MSDELLKDPLFQLNLILWLVQPLPETNSISPLLYQKGFRVFAIAPALGVPLRLVSAMLPSALSLAQKSLPDVIVANENDRKFALIECKASSFGVDTSQAKQARTFLLLERESLAEALGLNPAQIRDSMVVYVLPENSRASLEHTLSTLSQQLISTLPLSISPSTAIGLEIDSQSLQIVLSANGSQFFGLTAGSHPVMQLQAGNDPRPLYFIPYDPDISQSKEESRLCKRVLLERIHGVVLSAIGKAIPPTKLTLDFDKLLDEATFGMFYLWENRDSAKKMRRLCRQLITSLCRAVSSEVRVVLNYEPPQFLKVILEDAQQRSKVVKEVMRFSCETMNLEEELSSTLFEEE